MSPPLPILNNTYLQQPPCKERKRDIVGSKFQTDKVAVDYFFPSDRSRSAAEAFEFEPFVKWQTLTNSTTTTQI
jgi:hypothetical protein